VIRATSADWKPKGIDQLEPAAWKALRHPRSACVVAGPGAGKTEFLAQRADYLLTTETCRRSQRILAISFKRDAARNLAERVETRTPQGAPRFHSMTFDAFTKGIVDRFRASLPKHWSLRGPFEVRFPSARDVAAFLDDLAANHDVWHAKLHGLPRNTFLPTVVGSYSLPAEPVDPKSAVEFAVLQWWRRLYIDADPQAVEFVMLNRLAELIVHSTPQLRRALRATYPFVFIDEFQDTTYAQYSFLRSVFGDGKTIVTAVGDNKQRIMGWAGALEDAFDEFASDFEAEPFQLEWNFRSSEELIVVQHVVATTLDPSAKRAVSMADSSIDGDAAEIWCFASEEAEARHIADWIRDDATTSGRSPAEYALLARQKSADFEPLFARELQRAGMRLRNDDREVGKLRLQDLLADPVARLLLDLLKLGAAPSGNRDAWMAASQTVLELQGLHHAAENDLDADRSLSRFVRGLRSSMRTRHPSPSEARWATDRAVEFVGAEAVRRVFASHRTADAFELVVEAFKARMDQVAAECASWQQVCDEFEGRDAVSLMTVHKSKGLEYHTVFFLSIDDGQWWSLQREQEAATATFFVGLSRAEQRTIFTYCAKRGQRVAVNVLYDLLEAAGVNERVF
jgi:DNA helicase-2/ATP-dependent DNA helicase PcrA